MEDGNEQMPDVPDGDDIMDESEVNAGAEIEADAPSFLPEPRNRVYTLPAEQQYGHLVNEDVFCTVLKQLGLASNDQILSLMSTIRPVSKSAAESVSKTMSAADWVAPWSNAAKEYYAAMDDMLFLKHTDNPADAGLAGLAARKNYVSFVAGMREFRTILAVQEKAFRLILAHTTVPRGENAKDLGMRSKANSLDNFIRANTGVQTVILNVMRWHTKSPDIQKMGCRLIVCFFDRREDTAYGFTREATLLTVVHAMDTVHAVMTMFPNDVEMTQEACAATGRLCEYSNHRRSAGDGEYETRRNVLASQTMPGLQNKIIRAMQQNIQNDDICLAGCKILDVLLVKEQYDATTMRGIDVFLLEVINARVNNADFQTYGCLALASFFRCSPGDVADPQACVQFLVNTVQMAQDRSLAKCACLAMQGMIIGCTEAERLRRQKMFLEAGVARLLVVEINNLCVQARLRYRNGIARTSTTVAVQDGLLMWLSLMFRLTFQSRDMNKRFVDAGAFQMLMCTQSTMCTISSSVVRKTWDMESIESLIWRIFVQLQHQPTLAQTKCVHVQYRFMHPGFVRFAGASSTTNQNYINLWDALPSDDQGWITPFELACSVMQTTDRYDVIKACLVFIQYGTTTRTNCLLLGTPKGRSSILSMSNINAVSSILVAMTFSIKHRETVPRQSDDIQRCAVVTLLAIAKQCVLQPNMGLSNMIFRPVTTDLSQDTAYMTHLSQLQKRVATMEINVGSRLACHAILNAPGISTEDTALVQLREKDVAAGKDNAVKQVRICNVFVIRWGAPCNIDIYLYYIHNSCGVV